MSSTEAPRPPAWTKLVLLVISALLLSLAFAPFGQFYLAWLALVPWLWVISRARTASRAFLFGTLGGFLFFMPNFAYLWVITAPGSVALSLYMALFWGIVALALHVTRALHPDDSKLFRGSRLAATLAIAFIWTAGEYLRGTLLTGLPWLYLGHSQSPLLALCQIADFTGVYGITFWLALVNACLYFVIADRHRWRIVVPPAIATVLIILATLGYGIFRLLQRSVLYEGPKVLVVQPNDRLVRGKTEPDKQTKSINFHIETTLAALRKEPVDLVVWSETTMPPLNSEARSNSPDPILPKIDAGLRGLTGANRTSLVTGGYYVGDWKEIPATQPTTRPARRATDIRNSAYFYNPFRKTVARYDKIHIVPFGEFIPFRLSLPWLFQTFMWLSPYSEEYTINSGPEGSLTVFTLDPGAATPDASKGTTWRFVTPICFEDIDAPLVAQMFRPEPSNLKSEISNPKSQTSTLKRADFIINITNDGWFRFNQMPHHLQAALFRCIENRVPTARSVNTGISGFIDSLGRIDNSIPPRRSGTSTQRLILDRRLTFYTRFGDLFAIACTTLAALLVLLALILRPRKVNPTQPPTDRAV